MSDSAFHDHLDACRQCADHPFALCPIGAELLRKEATSATVFGATVTAGLYPDLPIAPFKVRG